MRVYGSEIRRKREHREWTQQYLADIAGWSVAKLSRVENNHQPLYVEDLDYIMEILESEKVIGFTYYPPALAIGS